MTADPKDLRTIHQAQRRTAEVNATRGIGETVPDDDPEPKPEKPPARPGSRPPWSVRAADLESAHMSEEGKRSMSDPVTLESLGRQQEQILAELASMRAAHDVLLKIVQRVSATLGKLISTSDKQGKPPARRRRTGTIPFTPRPSPVMARKTGSKSGGGKRSMGKKGGVSRGKKTAR